MSAAVETDRTRIAITSDAAGTRALGERLAAVAQAGDLIALRGDLGAGKTVLAKGFGDGLGVPDTISSPTFILMAEYEGRLPLFHLDLYRLADASEAVAGGLLDERLASGVTLIEWAERLGDALPAGRLDIRIEGAGDGTRRILLRAGDERHRRYLSAVGEGAA